jgi:hypothetical protein
MKNIFFLLLSVIAMSMFTSCEKDEPTLKSETIDTTERAFDTFKYEATGIGLVNITYMDSTNTLQTVQIGQKNSTDSVYWSYEFTTDKPYEGQLLSIQSNDWLYSSKIHKCKIYMNGELLNITPKANGQYLYMVYGELSDKQ